MYAANLSPGETSLNPRPLKNARRSTSDPQLGISPPLTFRLPTRQPSEASEGQQSNDGPEASERHEVVEEHIDGVDDSIHHEPSLPQDTLAYLHQLLTVPNRKNWTVTLTPENPQPTETTWFGRDGSGLVRKITRIFTQKFDEAYYSISCVPPERLDRWFIEFAKEHTWDPLITGTVQAHFNAIVARRLKDMVSKAHSAGVRPIWIKETIWKEMTDYWATDEGRGRSQTASACRNSDREGLGPHRNFTGQKSYTQIKQEMEVEFGRPVSLGEVFLRTHTKPDGTYVDGKAERIAKTYEANLAAKRAEIESETSDGTSREPVITTEECNEVFLKSTFVDERSGQVYGIGNLNETLPSIKRKYTTGSSSSAYVSLQQQLQETQRKLEAESARNERLEVELTQQKAKSDQLSLMEKYYRQTDKGYLAFLESQTDRAASPTASPTDQTASLAGS